jgi:hypothetical protein
MDVFKQFALNMYPFWILGILVIGSVIASGNKSLLRIKRKPLIKWIGFLAFITAIRFVLYRIAMLSETSHHMHQAVAMFPWYVGLTVFWEDAAHGLPLLILRKLLSKSNKYIKLLYYPVLLAVMVEFGIGHLYQGILPAMLLSFYIPYSVKVGEKNGFGTVMIGHMLYDIVTLLSVQYFIGM